VARLTPTDPRFIYIVPPEIAPFRNLLPFIPDSQLADSLYILVSGKPATQPSISPAAPPPVLQSPQQKQQQPHQEQLVEESHLVNVQPSQPDGSTSVPSPVGEEQGTEMRDPSQGRERATVEEEDISLTLGEDLEAGEVRGDDGATETSHGTVLEAI